MKFMKKLMIFALVFSCIGNGAFAVERARFELDRGGDIFGLFAGHYTEQARRKAEDFARKQVVSERQRFAAEREKERLKYEKIIAELKAAAAEKEKKTEELTLREALEAAASVAGSVHYNRIVEIKSFEDNLTLWSSSYHPDADETVAPAERLADSQSFFSVVGGGPDGDVRETNGSNFFLIQNANNPSDTGPVRYGDTLEIYALTYDAQNNKVELLNPPRKLTVEASDIEGRFELVITHPDHVNDENGQELFSFVGAEGEKGPIDQFALVKILSNSGKASDGAELWQDSKHHAFGKEFADYFLGNAPNQTANLFYFKEVNKSDLSKAAQAVYEKIINARLLETAINVPQGFTEEQANAMKIAVGSRDEVIEAWYADSKGNIFRFEPGSKKENPWVFQVSNDDQGNTIFVKDISVSSDGQLYVLSHDGDVFMYNWTTKDFMMVPAGKGNENLVLTQISVGNGENIWAVDGKNNDIYRHTPDGWQLEKDGTGAYVAAGVDGTVLAIDLDNKVSQYKDGEWIAITGVELTHVAVGDKNHMWGVDLDGGLWQFEDGSWSEAIGADGKASFGLADVRVNAAGAVFALSAGGNTFNNSEAGIIIKKALKVEEGEAKEVIKTEKIEPKKPTRKELRTTKKLKKVKRNKMRRGKKRKKRKTRRKLHKKKQGRRQVTRIGKTRKGKKRRLMKGKKRKGPGARKKKKRKGKKGKKHKKRNKKKKLSPEDVTVQPADVETRA